MAVKKATIIVDVDDKSLLELNDEIKTLETSISKLKIGTAEWNRENQKLGQLKTKFNDATREASKLQAVVEKVGGAEQARSIAKLGQGIVGAFAGVQNAIGLMGGSSKAFDEITAKGVQFLAVMQGLNAVSETFSKENIKGLASVGKSFGTLLNTVKTASAGMKAALISTGIGALVVGVGLLIANWDKLVKLVNGGNKRIEESIRNTIAITEEHIKMYGEMEKVMQSTLNLEKEKQVTTGKSLGVAQAEYNLYKQRGLLIAAEMSSLEEQLKLQQQILSTNDENTKEYDDAKKEIDIINAKLKEQGKIEEQNSKNTINARSYIQIADAIDEINDRINDNKNRLIVIGSELDNQKDTYNTELNIIKDQITILNKIKETTGQLNDVENDKLDNLKAQEKALVNQERQRVKIQTIAIDDLENERKRLEYINKINNAYKEYINAISNEQSKLNVNAQINERNAKFIDEIQDKYYKLKDIRAEINNFDVKGREMILEQTKELDNIVSNYQEQISASENILRNNLEGKRVRESVVKQASEELFLKTAQFNLDKSILENNKKQLEIDNERLKATADNLRNNIDASTKEKKSIDDKINGLKEVLNTQGISDEKRLRTLEEVNSLEQKSADINNNIIDSTQQLIDTTNQYNENLVEIDSTKLNLLATDQQILSTTNEITAAVENQSRAYVGLQEFVTKYNQEIQASQQVLSAGIEMIASLQDRKAKVAQQRINKYQKQLDALNDEEEDRQSRLVDLEEELQDANGERYDELLSMIDQEKTASIETKTAIEEKQKEIDAEDKKRREAEYKAAKWRKALSIMEAIVAGALAVVKALPNVFLSVASGVIAAANVAIIASQKLPPKDFAVGGYTGNGGKYEPAGIVHKGEYVIPSEIVSRPSNMGIIENLESQRLKGYDSGGLVTPALNSGTQNLIDYEKLGAVILDGISKLPNPQVSVLKITAAQNEINLTKQNAGLSRG